MRHIFISYRRSDTKKFAKKIVKSINNYFGKQSVFIDTNNIVAGSAWSEVIEGQLTSAAAVLCIIGSDWVGLQAESSRIDDSDDWVRREIYTALVRQIPILPLLTKKAHLPELKELPPEIRPILNVQTIRTSPQKTNFQTLIDWVATYLVPTIYFSTPLTVDMESIAKAGVSFCERLHTISTVIHPRSYREIDDRFIADMYTSSVRQPISWHSDLLEMAHHSEIPSEVRERNLSFLNDIERRLSKMWIGLLRYSGPPGRHDDTSMRAAVNLLRFSALKVMHELTSYIEDNPNMQPVHNKGYRWEWCMDRFFSKPEEIANAYVSHVSGLNIMPQPELCIYSPRWLAERSYDDSHLRRGMTTSWYGGYFVPQLEILLASTGSEEPDFFVRYDGIVTIRKVVDWEGTDLPD